MYSSHPANLKNGKARGERPSTESAQCCQLYRSTNVHTDTDTDTQTHTQTHTHTQTRTHEDKHTAEVAMCLKVPDGYGAIHGAGCNELLPGVNSKQLKLCEKQ